MRFLRHFPLKNFVRFHSFEYRKTAAIFMNDYQGAPLMINSYSSNGFTLNNNLKIIGSVALFPRSVLAWNVQKADDINLDSLALFYILDPKIDVLIIGTGDGGSKFNYDLSVNLYLKNKELNTEILPTDKACSAYNFLVTEGRFVAAALIPPRAYLADYKPLIEHMNKEYTRKQTVFPKNVGGNESLPKLKKEE